MRYYNNQLFCYRVLCYAVISFTIFYNFFERLRIPISIFIQGITKLPEQQDNSVGEYFREKG